jgi:Cof subfamily protein (haloacid dehalogenase superfamily)
MVVTDLDGTLLNSQGQVSSTDIDTLARLGDSGVVRAIATGRSPYSFSKVIPSDFPIDYLIFSSGAGTLEWATNKILYTTEIPAQQVQSIVDELIAHRVDFMVHEPIPANHRFLYHQSGNHNPDFLNRVEIYSPYCQPYIPGVAYDTAATQILAVLPYDVEWFEVLRGKFPSLKVIRATSPLDGHSIWMEIFRRDVSKAYGIRWLCQKLGIENDEVLTLGNDFNDLDMLGSFENSFVVANAPEELKSKFSVVKSNNESGFSDAVNRFL